MHRESSDNSYRLPPEQRGYYELSSAIVRTAVEDYRAWKKATYRTGRAYGSLESLRAFFLSDVFEKISGFDSPQEFLAKLDRQIDEEIANNVKRKRIKKQFSR